MTGQNIGDLLNAKGITWGWFQGGFAPTGTTSTGGARLRRHPHQHRRRHRHRLLAAPRPVPVLHVHRQPRPHSRRPAWRRSATTDQANHQYDLSWFNQALDDGNLPAVSYLKAAEYQDGHAGYSDPIDEQHFLVNTINAIEQSRYWHNTAIVITYDDSDGWYDHVAPTIINSSGDPALDALNGTGVCGHGTPWAASRTAAATASGCRSWSSRPTPRATTSATPPPTSPPSSRSSRTTGWADSASAAPRSTTWRAR